MIKLAPAGKYIRQGFVGIVKDTLKKAKQSGIDPQLAMLCLRSTPIDVRTPSPAELLYGRKIHYNLPAKDVVSLLYPVEKH